MFVTQYPKHFTQIADNYSLVYVILLNFFGQLKKIESDKHFFQLVVRRDKLKNMLMQRPAYVVVNLTTIRSRPRRPLKVNELTVRYKI